jgi:hypothetical protein
MKGTIASIDGSRISHGHDQTDPGEAARTPTPATGHASLHHQNAGVLDGLGNLRKLPDELLLEIARDPEVRLGLRGASRKLRAIALEKTTELRIKDIRGLDAVLILRCVRLT